MTGYFHAGRQQPFFILRDLDDDAPCAAQWVSPFKLPLFACLRLAVRSIEAWLMADTEACAAHFGVAAARLPRNPDALSRPRDDFMALLQRSSNPRIKRNLLPKPGWTSPVGPGFTQEVAQYAATAWRPQVAARRSESLRRARASLHLLASRWGALSGTSS